MDINRTLALYRNVCDTRKLGDNPSALLYFESVDDIRQPHLFNKYFVPIMATYAVTFIFGVVGNVISVVAMSSSRAAHNATNIFLVSLAVADLLMLVIHLPLEVVEYFFLTWDKSGGVCKIKAYVYFLSGMASVLNLAAVSIERYIVIVYPMKSRSICTTTNCRKVLFIVWVLAIILTAPVVITMRVHPFTFVNNKTCITAYYCWDLDEGHMLAFSIATYQLIFMFCIPLLLMSFCYTRVVKVLWISAKQMTAISSSRSDDFLESNTDNMHRTTSVCIPSPKQEVPLRVHTNLLHVNGNVIRARKQVIKMLLLVIVLFMGCWGPRLFINAIIKYGLSNYNHMAYEARFICYLLAFVHSCLNPIVYSLMSSNVRQMILRSIENTCSTSKKHICGRILRMCTSSTSTPPSNEYKEFFRHHRASSSEMICYSTRTTHLSSISTLAEYRASVILDSDVSNYVNLTNDVKLSTNSSSVSSRRQSTNPNRTGKRMSNVSSQTQITTCPVSSAPPSTHISHKVSIRSSLK